jgi:hypothetical protein
MITKEDTIRQVDRKLVWCSQVIEDGTVLNKIQKLQNDIQYFSNAQLGMLLDTLEEFNANKPETISKLLNAAGKIGKE